MDNRKVGRPRLADTDLKKKSLIVSLVMLLVSIALLAGGLISLNILPKFNKLKGEVVCTEIPARFQPRSETNPEGLHEYGFDDINFYSSIVNRYDRFTCDNITEEDLATVNFPISEKKGIKSVNGIQYLTGLTRISLYTGDEISGEDNDIREIDLSHNTNLTSLQLYGNVNLREIDLSHNTELTHLDLAYTNLSSIDLSHNTALTELSLENNQLREIDLSQNTALTYLYLSNNQLSNIDLSNNTLLKSLNLSHNQLVGTLDLSMLTNIDYHGIDLSYNKISSVTLPQILEDTADEIDLSNNNITNVYGLDEKTNIGGLYVSNNQIYNLDLSGIENLQALVLGNNPMFETKYLYKGEEIEYNPIVLNQKYEITTEISDENIISLSNNKLKGLKSGTSNIKISNGEIISIDADMYARAMAGEEIDESQAILDYIVKQEIKVYDVESNKYAIDTNKKEIDVKGKEINTEDIDLGLGGLTGIVEGSNYIIKDGDTIVDTYKLVNMKKDEVKPSDTDNKEEITTTNNNNVATTTKKVTTKKKNILSKIFGSDKKEEPTTTTNAIINKIIKTNKGTTTTKVVEKKDNINIRWIMWPILLIILIIGYITYKRSKK